MKRHTDNLQERYLMSKDGYYKDKECLRCDKFFDCPGKPKEVDGRRKTLCIRFEERKKYGK